MPRKPSSTLTEAEQQLMEIIWDRRSATVAEVLGELSPKRKLAFNTVQTTMRILEAKGYLKHKAEGRAFRYYPRVGRKQASASAVNQLLKRFFGGVPSRLALNVLQNERLDDGELAELQHLIDQARSDDE
ncbi:MAG: MarR family transcriptional regulator [Candidatus Eremiobacter antarcticus]|nr:BlaI/MecI/CopY family transcriptional regulator [Candidatus Eremiobacteraeota bacterium]MBC5809173.1 BlaI/MecI/CopY family transcriptional regulator [Candidatus Eremiobacteraeota bacterium]PZR61785.1 MAG: MarR family transcriptional regulator [Candidatus Eremiobacter sp. RRmetagenome_bin22]